MKNVTGLVVSYNTKDLLKRALDSIRQFYPDMPIIVIDGSDQGNECAEYVKSLGENYTTVCLYNNIGHGKGMHMGIEMITTDYIMVFDSDIEMTSGGVIEKMIKKFKTNTYGVGRLQCVSEKGLSIKASGKECENQGGIAYLHPSFMIISATRYKRFKPFVHHGAPLIRTMIDIAEKNLSNRILIDFPVANFVDHQWRGTRNINPPEFLKNWE